LLRDRVTVFSVLSSDAFVSSVFSLSGVPGT